MFYELSVELTFPVAEACSSGFLIFARLFVTALVTLLIIPVWRMLLVSDTHGIFKVPECINWIQVFTCCACGWSLLLMEESRHRSDADILSVSEYEPLL